MKEGKGSMRGGEEILEEARKAYKVGKYEEAQKFCEKVASEECSKSVNAERLLLLGAISYKMHRYHESIEHNMACLRFDDSFAEAYSNMGNAYKAMGDFINAKHLYQEAIRLKPSFSDAYINLAGVELALGQENDAIARYEAALRLEPENGSVCCHLAALLRSKGEIQAAYTRLVEGAARNVQYAPIWCALAVCQRDVGRSKEAAESYRYAISLLACVEEEEEEEKKKNQKQNLADLYSNLGNCLKESNQIEGAIEAYTKAIALEPHFSAAYGNLASCFMESGKIKKAIDTFHIALQIQPDFPDALNNLGNAFREDDQLEKAVECYQKALKLQPDHAHATNNLGNAYKDRGLMREAIACYETAIRLAPGLAAANSNLGLVLKERGDLTSAIAHYRQAIAIDPHFTDAYSNLGNALKDSGSIDQAIQCYLAAIKLKPDYVDAYSNLASAYKDTGRYSEAIEYYRKALYLRPHFDDAFANLVHSLVFICDWSTRDDDFTRLRTIIHTQLALDDDKCTHDIQEEDSSPSKKRQRLSPTNIKKPKAAENRGRLVPSVQPFHTLVYPISNKDVLYIAQRYAQRAFLSAKMHELPMPLFSAIDHTEAARLCPHAPVVHNKSIKRLRVGYVSSDFGNHPLAHLTQSIFGMHQRQRFDVICYSLSAHDGSQWRRKIESQVESFVDISHLTPRDAGLTIRSHDVDLLVNLNGYTKGARNEIFALQPAPLQISYMGFCGTLGASYVQYMVADHTVIPNEHAQFYSESIIRLPHSYFVNDHAQSAQFMLDDEEDTTSDREHTRKNAHTKLTRDTYGVPASATFVFANFNQIYKIDPDIFDVWCRILKRVQGSVLWLLRFPPMGEENIRAEARKRGIDDSTQLHFTAVSPKDEHIRRGALADLFLDTPQCNAHTTGCDILWGGCPMITTLGTKMATRVAASLLRAVDAHELVAESTQAYEDLAVELATNQEKYNAIRTKIKNARRQPAPLWDTLRWVRNLEQGYEAIWQRHKAELEPDHIEVDDVGTHSLDREAYRQSNQQKGPPLLAPAQSQLMHHMPPPSLITIGPVNTPYIAPYLSETIIPSPALVHGNALYANGSYSLQACPPQLYVPNTAPPQAVVCYPSNANPPYLFPPPPPHHQLRPPTHFIHQASPYPPYAPTPPHHFLNTPGMVHSYDPLAPSRIQTAQYPPPTKMLIPYNSTTLAPLGYHQPTVVVGAAAAAGHHAAPANLAAGAAAYSAQHHPYFVPPSPYGVSSGSSGP